MCPSSVKWRGAACNQLAFRALQDRDFDQRMHAQEWKYAQRSPPNLCTEDLSDSSLAGLTPLVLFADDSGKPDDEAGQLGLSGSGSEGPRVPGILDHGTSRRTFVCTLKRGPVNAQAPEVPTCAFRHP